MRVLVLRCPSPAQAGRQLKGPVVLFVTEDVILLGETGYPFCSADIRVSRYHLRSTTHRRNES